jgi:hypothetical protein
MLSSDRIIAISHQYLTPNPPPIAPAPHPVLTRAGPLRLGLSMSNLNGVDYTRRTMSGGAVTYTRHADQYTQALRLEEGYVAATWEALRAAAVSCGAFPLAFRVQDVVRNITDYLSSPYFDPASWAGRPSMAFCYTDGGVFQNQPLGMAKNLVEAQPDGHLGAEQRGYLFIAPRPKRSDADQGFHSADANYKATVARLGGAILGQAEFQDWAMAESVNDRIGNLNRLADDLRELFASGALNAQQTRPVTTELLAALVGRDGPPDPNALDAARRQLATQYADEHRSLAAGTADAWLDALLVLEIAANLHEKEEMYIFDFVADPAMLAGGGLFAFTGFFDVAYRKHDYDYGRSVAQQRLRAYGAAPAGVFSGLRWTPRPIDPIDPRYNDVAMKDVDEGKRRAVFDQIMAAADALLSELGANLVERKVVEFFLIRNHVKDLLAL